MLCKYCSGITPLFSAAITAHNSELGYDKLPVPHYDSFAGLQVSAAEGCKMCTLLYEDISPTIDTDAARFTEKIDFDLSLETDDTCGTPKVRRMVWICYIASQDRRPFGSVTICSLLDRRFPEAESLLYSKEKNEDPCSEVAIGVIQDWISTCILKHKTCQRDAINAPTMPTRVIDVGTNDTSVPYLLVTNGRKGEYAAFSHVWGRRVPVRTVKENLGRHLKALPTETLPRSFADAIRVTKTLGLRYLWIDALCIVQDSTEDWAFECTKMSKVYSDAYVTIAAPDTSGCEEGFLHNRTRPRLSLNMPYIDATGIKRGEVGFRQLSAEQSFVGQRSILHCRGWTLQEQLMSRRLVYFGASQNYWECFGTSREERYSHAVCATSSLKTAFRPHGSISARTWFGVVEDYSDRNLTYSADKFPALSALAKLYHTANHDRYLAGLWEKDLIAGLAWYGYSLSEKVDMVDGAYRAPSWSWASIERWVTFDWQENCAQHASLLSSVVKLRSIDPFGAIDFASITLRARLKEILLISEKEGEEEEEEEEKEEGVAITATCRVRILTTPSEHCKFHNLRLDRYIPASFSPGISPVKYFCLELSTSTYGDLSDATSSCYKYTPCLVVERIALGERMGNYRRVGFVGLKADVASVWFEDRDLMDITLV